MKEEWKKFRDSFYEGSNLGRIKRVEHFSTNAHNNGFKLLKERNLKLSVDKNGRQRVTIRINGKSTHFQVSRFILECFVGPCPEGMEACHDPDPCVLNNRLNNLRWDTPKNNYKDRAKYGNSNIGEKNPRAKLKEEDVKLIRLLWAENKYKKVQIAKMFNITPTTTLHIIKKKLWKFV